MDLSSALNTLGFNVPPYTGHDLRTATCCKLALPWEPYPHLSRATWDPRYEEERAGIQSPNCLHGNHTLSDRKSRRHDILFKSDVVSVTVYPWVAVDPSDQWEFTFNDNALTWKLSLPYMAHVDDIHVGHDVGMLMMRINTGVECFVCYSPLEWT